MRNKDIFILHLRVYSVDFYLHLNFFHKCIYEATVADIMKDF